MIALILSVAVLFDSLAFCEGDCSSTGLSLMALRQTLSQTGLHSNREQVQVDKAAAAELAEVAVGVSLISAKHQRVHDRSQALEERASVAQELERQVSLLAHSQALSKTPTEVEEESEVEHKAGERPKETPPVQPPAGGGVRSSIGTAAEGWRAAPLATGQAVVGSPLAGLEPATPAAMAASTRGVPAARGSTGQVMSDRLLQPELAAKAGVFNSILNREELRKLMTGLADRAMAMRLSLTTNLAERVRQLESWLPLAVALAVLAGLLCCLFLGRGRQQQPLNIEPDDTTDVYEVWSWNSPSTRGLKHVGPVSSFAQANTCPRDDQASKRSTGPPRPRLW